MSEATTRRRIRVQTMEKDPQTLRFILEAPVQKGVQESASACYEDANAEAPLAGALFALSGVQRVEVDGASIYVSGSVDMDFSAMKAPIAAAIRDVLDQDALPLGQRGNAPTDEDARLLLAVADLLDRQANPSIASHGGNVAVERVENSDVYLRMSGGCQGCAASAATLRTGIETMLRAALPAIGKIIDLTDHGAGTNPFYSDAQGKSPTFNRPLPLGVIDWEDGQVIIDPEYLAPKLGLTPDTLRAGMRNGDIVSRSETGTDDDAGKTRVTVRTPQRAWSAEVLADGTAREIPPPRGRSIGSAGEEKLADQVRQYLQNLAEDEVPIAYGKLARALGHWAPGSIGKLTKALELTMREDALTATPFIAARAVSRGADKLPGKGFFELAHALKQGPTTDETDRGFHDRLLAEVASLLVKTQLSAPE
ncbi:MAG: Fe-S cluster biogenesis protein NfuA [Yoonia sp.]|jgi:Fe-S cluster biogenesis protein NfuA